MIARCARCQQTFSTERFGVQTCPHCGGQVLLAEPGAPGAGAPPPPEAPGSPTAAAPPPPAGAPPPGWGGPPPGWAQPPGAPPVEESAPFVRRKQLGFLAAYFRTWKLAALDPAAFFRGVRIGESGSAVLFAVISITVSQWFQTLYSWLVNTSMRGFMQELMRRMPQQGEIDPRIVELVSGTHPGMLAARIIGAPLYALIVVFLTAGVVHLCLLLFRAAPRGFEATLTVVGYASGVQLLAAAPVPLLAPLAAFVWFLVATIVGLGEAQRCGNGKAAAATLLPGALLCLCCCGGAGFLGFLAGAAKHGG